MKFLNLTPGFNPYGAKENDIIEFEEFTFSGGEPNIKIRYEYHYDNDPGISIRGKISVLITQRINSGNDLLLLQMAVDAIRRLYLINELYLFIPYFPGARQDRVCNEGEALAVKVYADIINSMGFNTVVIFDAHSDVTPSLLDNCTVMNNHRFVGICLNKIYPKITLLEALSPEDKKGPFLVSPDAGANKKIGYLAKHLYRLEMEVLKCDKTRDVSTGKITNFEVYADNLEGRDCIIVDDICDAGGTFLGLAKALKAKNAGKLYLIVSHGIFSKGLYKLEDIFDHIYTTDSIKTLESENFTQINLTEALWEI